MNEAIQQAIIDGAPGISVTCSAADLKAVLLGILRGERELVAAQAKAQAEQGTLTRKEVMGKLGVSETTLNRWQKTNYLVPVKVGAKCLYKVSDVNKILTKKAV